MFVEKLEDRRLMSVTQVGSVLTVNGTDAADDITVREEAPGVVSVVGANGDNALYMGVTQVNINGFGGDDNLTFTGLVAGLDLTPGQVNAVIDGGNGNDQINVTEGAVGGSQAFGGNGDDSFSIFANTSNATLVHGDNNDDTIIVTTGTAIVYGDNGQDTIVVAGTATNTQVYGGNGGDTIVVAGSTNTADGGNGGDTITHV